MHSSVTFLRANILKHKPCKTFVLGTVFGTYLSQGQQLHWSGQMWSALHEDGKIAHSTPLLVGGFQLSLGIYCNLGK